MMLRIRETSDRCESVLFGQPLKLFLTVLIGIFRMNCFVLFEGKPLIGNRDDLIDSTFQMHFNPSLLFIIKSDMLE